MGPHGSDLAQNLTQLLQVGFPTRFDAARGPKTLIFEFLKSCNFRKIAGVRNTVKTPVFWPLMPECLCFYRQNGPHMGDPLATVPHGGYG